MDDEIAGRADRLRSLAEQCARFAYDLAAACRAPRVTGRARRAVERADSAMLDAARWEARTDPVAELADRTEAVLAAYRDLMTEPRGTR